MLISIAIEDYVFQKMIFGACILKIFTVVYVFCDDFIIYRDYFQ